MTSFKHIHTAVFMLGLLAATSALTEDAGTPPGAGAPGAGGAGAAAPGGGNRSGGRGNFDPEQMRQRGLERIKEGLGASDDEWKALLPKVEAVQKLQTQTRTTMLGRRRSEPAGGNAPAADAKPAPEKSDVEKKTQELQTLIDDKNADPNAVKAKTQELREAREKAKLELKKAQDELRAGLTPRQEAQLVLAGLLE